MNQQISWCITDSPRTPSDLTIKLKDHTQLKAFYRPFNTTEDNWLQEYLPKCREIWVSEDSVSMIYEALTTDAEVGLISVPKRRETRVTKISKDLILNVIKARSDEIFEMFKNQLKVNGFNFNSGINIFLTGEGSNLKNVEKYCQEFFGLNSAVKKKEKLEKIFPACFGGIRIIKDGWETEAIPEVKDKGIEKIGFLRKLFGNH